MTKRARAKVGNSVPTSDAQVGSRISAVADLYGSRKSAAESAGVSTDQLARYIRGENLPPMWAMARLAHGRGVSLDWLATGQGPMRIGEAVPAVPPPPPRPSETRPAESDGDAAIDRMLQAVSQRGLKEWAATLPGGDARKFPIDLVVMIIEQLETALRITGNSPSPWAKKVAVFALCDHFERVGKKDQDAVLGNVVRLFA